MIRAMTNPSPALPGVARPAPAFALLLFAVGGLVLLLVALLFVLHQRDAKEQRETLITDMLWFEQTLRFQLNSDAEKLQQLAASAWVGDLPEAQSSNRAQVVMGSNPEIDRIRWYDSTGALLASEPPLGAAPGLTETELAYVRKMGRPTFSAPVQLASQPGHWDIDLVVPIFRQGQFVGAMAGAISLDALLNDQARVGPDVGGRAEEVAALANAAVDLDEVPVL